MSEHCRVVDLFAVGARVARFDFVGGEFQVVPLQVLEDAFGEVCAKQFVAFEAVVEGVEVGASFFVVRLFFYLFLCFAIVTQTVGMSNNFTRKCNSQEE